MTKRADADVAMNFDKEAPHKWLVDSLHLNDDVHQRVPIAFYTYGREDICEKRVTRCYAFGVCLSDLYSRNQQSVCSCFVYSPLEWRGDLARWGLDRSCFLVIDSFFFSWNKGALEIYVVQQLCRSTSAE